MAQVDGLVQTTAVELKEPALALPHPVMVAFQAVHRVHRVWRWFRMGKIYSNPDNFLKLAAGHGLNFAFGDSVMLRISAVSLLIATRIFECVEQYGKLEKSWGRVMDAFCNRYPKPVKLSWEISAKSSFLSPSTVIWWRYHFEDFKNRVQRVAFSFFGLCKQIFCLSMRVMDAVETFSLSPSTRNEGINQFFVNGTKWVDRLVENKELLLDGLQAHQEVIDKILKGIQSPLTAEQLIATAAFGLEKTAKLHTASEKVCQGVGGFMVACGKNWGYEFLWQLGLHHLAPPYLIPPPSAPWVVPAHKKLQSPYPDEKLVTKPSQLKKLAAMQAAAVKKPAAKAVPLKAKDKPLPKGLQLIADTEPSVFSDAKFGDEDYLTGNTALNF